VGGRFDVLQWLMLTVLSAADMIRRVMCTVGISEKLRNSVTMQGVAMLPKLFGIKKHEWN
jgi:hypothetical protein